jgi:hypothetical protein
MFLQDDQNSVITYGMNSEDQIRCSRKKPYCSCSGGRSVGRRSTWPGRHRRRSHLGRLVWYDVGCWRLRGDVDEGKRFVSLQDWRIKVWKWDYFWIKMRVSEGNKIPCCFYEFLYILSSACVRGWVYGWWLSIAGLWLVQSDRVTWYGSAFRWTLIGPSWRHANARRLSGRCGLWMWEKKNLITFVFILIR